MRLALWLTLLTSPCWAVQQPFFPYISMSLTAAGMATSEISVSVYVDGSAANATDTDRIPRMLKEWGLCVVPVGGTSPTWWVELQVSNDSQTWTPLLTHRKETGSGFMVWGAHHAARRARLQLKAVSSGTTVTSTAYAE